MSGGTRRPFREVDTVRAMLERDDLSDTEITAAATKIGWPQRDVHPFLVAEKLER